MADKLAMLAYAVEQADTSRTALLRFTVSAALAYAEASVIEGNKGGDEVKAALKLALRERGQDRKTADRVVNNACKLGMPLTLKINDAVDWNQPVIKVVQDVLDLAALDGIKNAAGLAVWLGVAEPEKAKKEKGADLAATIGGMADAGGAGDAPMGEPSKAQKPQEAAMSQNETFTPASLDLTTLTDDQLAMLAEMVAAEMAARAGRAAIAA